MYILAGLGNPTSQYNNTRHNVGFDAIDAIAEKYSIKVETLKHKALVGTGIIDGKKVILVKPQTYMNLSGEALRAVADFYKADVKNELIVIYDDISLDLGTLRARRKGSAGGHNGIKSIIAHLGTEEFSRIKIGIGQKPEGRDLADFVLSHFTPSERKLLDGSIDKVTYGISLFLNDGIDKCMNELN